VRRIHRGDDEESEGVAPMKRRSCLKAMLAAAGGAVLPAVALADSQASDGRPIQLHADLAVDPAKEREMLEFFEQKFRPAAAQQPGYIDLKMLKLKSTLRGAAPPGTNYQFVLTFSSEALRQKWVATELHKQLWPVIEGSLTDKNYSRLLYEVY
jgi:heme-degrading monooxygenase HmoA